MSILASIVSKILGHHGNAPASSGSGATVPSASPASATTATPPAPAGPAPATPPAGGAPAVSATADASARAPSGSGPAAVDVTAVLDRLAAQSRERLDWQHSIVDMMKLLGLDSSLSARQALAQELHYSGDLHDSASMNLWLHKQVMQKLAENGGKVPDDLRS